MTFLSKILFIVIFLPARCGFAFLQTRDKICTPLQQDLFCRCLPGLLLSFLRSQNIHNWKHSSGPALDLKGQTHEIFDRHLFCQRSLRIYFFLRYFREWLRISWIFFWTKLTRDLFLLDCCFWEYNFFFLLTLWIKKMSSWCRRNY